MAVRFQDGLDVTKSDMLGFDPDDIIIPELTGRHVRDTDVKWLVDDMLEKGQLQPVGIRKDALKRPVGVFGFTRILAGREIKKLHPEWRIKAILLTVNEEEAFIRTISENDVRRQVSAIDTAYNIRQLQERFSYSDQKVADTYKKTVSWVTDHTALLVLPEDVKLKIHNGEISAVTGRTLAGIDPAKLPEVMKEAAEVFTEGKKAGRVTNGSVAKVLQNKPGVETSKPIMKTVKQMRDFVNDNLGSKNPNLHEFLVEFNEWIHTRQTDDSFIEYLSGPEEA